MSPVLFGTHIRIVIPAVHRESAKMLFQNAFAEAGVSLLKPVRNTASGFYAETAVDNQQDKLSFREREALHQFVTQCGFYADYLARLLDNISTGLCAFRARQALQQNPFPRSQKYPQGSVILNFSPKSTD